MSEDNVTPIEQGKPERSEKVEKARQIFDEKVQVVKSKAQEVSDEVGKKVGKKFQEVSGDVGERFKKVSEDVKREAGKAGEVARERANVAAENVRVGYEKARKDFGHVNEDLNDYVRDNPARSILIAAGIGFVLGLIFRGGGRSDF